MRRILLAFPLALFSARAADAGQILKYSEEGVRHGRAYRSTTTLSAAPEGVRVEARDVEGSGPEKTVVFLYSAPHDRIYPLDPPTGPVISKASIAVLEERARASGHRARPGSFTVTPLHTTHDVGGWTCSAWALRRSGQAPRVVYLADPAAVGVEASTRANLRRMGALFVRFVNAMHLAEGDLVEGFNTHELDQGFPVREFTSKDGVVEMDSQLVSVRSADLSPDLFRVPGPPAPAAPGAAAPAPAPDRSITPEAWALRGMPDPSRAWTGADYDAAAGLLETVAKENATGLPRENSAVSGGLFHRFVDPGNLASIREAGTAGERARAGAGVLSGADRISLVYAGAYRDDATRGAELASLMAYTLFAAREVVPLADVALAAAPETDQNRAARLESRKRAHEALASVVNACLASLATPGGFRPAERLRLARAVEEHVPALRAYLPAGDRRELPARLTKMMAAELDPAVRDILDRVRAALR